MTEQELKQWFWNKFSSCYYVVHEDYPKSLFMYYDEKFIRKIKLCKLGGKDIKMPSVISGICLFEQDYKNGYLYMDYDEITDFFYKNYSKDYFRVKEMVTGWLKDSEKMSMLSPNYQLRRDRSWLKDSEKMSMLSPEPVGFASVYWLKDSEKMSMLSPVSKVKESEGSGASVERL